MCKSISFEKSFTISQTLSMCQFCSCYLGLKNALDGKKYSIKKMNECKAVKHKHKSFVVGMLIIASFSRLFIAFTLQCSKLPSYHCSIKLCSCKPQRNLIYRHNICILLHVRSSFSFNYANFSILQKRVKVYLLDRFSRKSGC